MPSTFSQSLRLELIGTGEQSGVWGTTTNNNLGDLIEQAVTGSTSLDVSLGNVTLTALNGVVDQSRSAFLLVSGTPGTTRILTIPNVKKPYTVRNTSDSTVQVKTSGGVAFNIPSAAFAYIYCDGSNNVVGRIITDGANAITSLAAPFNSPTFTGVPIAPTAAQGTNTTQIATTAFVNAEIAADTANLAPLNSPALTGIPTAPTAAVGTNTTQLATTAFVNAEIANDAPTKTGGGASGTWSISVTGSAVSAVTQAVTSNDTSIATTAFVRSIVPAGVILMWSGSIATIPSGWLLCNGTNGTPDLRDRFVIGAGSSYAVGATGGATTATLSVTNLPSHTHTGTTNSTSISHTHSFSATTGTESATHTHGGSGTTSTTNISHSHSFSATSGATDVTHSHTGSGTTSIQSNDHFHGVSGNTGGQSADHSHSGTTASENQNHTHGYSGTTSGVGDHAHGYTAGSYTSNVITFNNDFLTTFDNGGVGASTGGAGAHSHTFSGNTGGISNNHQHGFSTGGVSSDHSHFFSVNSGGISANHTHTYNFTTSTYSGNHTHSVSGTTGASDPAHAHTYSFTTGTQSANHTHNVSGTTGASDPAHTHTFTTDATGSGTAFSIMPPYYALCFIMKS